MKKRISDYAFLFGFVLYVFLGTIVSIIVLPFLLLGILAKRSYIFIRSGFYRMKTEGRMRLMRRGIRKMEKRIACQEDRVIKLRDKKEQMEKLKEDTSRILKEILPLEEAIEENYGCLEYFRELLRRDKQLKKEPEKFTQDGRSTDGNLPSQEAKSV